MDLAGILDTVSTTVNQNFSALSPHQLNWKPHPSKWSIAQCLDHLIVSNATYFPVFDRLIDGSYRLPLAQRLNPFNKVFGPLMVRALGPQAKKKLKNPPLFTPSASALDTTVIADFLVQQQKLKDYFGRLSQMNTGKTVITSPVSNVISYSLEHAMQIIAVHEQRHIQQAMNVMHHEGFAN